MEPIIENIDTDFEKQKKETTDSTINSDEVKQNSPKGFYFI